jgi:phenylpropionate dioxygenase-like ring-hydroxylating dioxygenase large terminal subunit
MAPVPESIAMQLPPHTTSQLGRIRSQIASGRREWQDSREPVARIPVEHYVSDAVRAAEIERLFRPLPLIVGHAAELPRGHVLAHDEYGVPMLLTRDADGRFRAFLNVCRHRGMRLVEAGDAAVAQKSIVCPYHGWTYRLEGALRHRLHAEAFDACPASDDESLVALPAEERHGLLWVVPTPGATINVAAHLREFDGELPFFGIEGLRLFRTVRAEYPANWKLIVDAFLEAYHIRVLHKDTIYPFFADGLTAADRFGPHIQSLVARRAAEPWASDGATMPGDMAALCEIATPSQVVFPNTITIFHPDYLSLITLYPVGAETLSWTHRMLIPADRATPDWSPHWEKTFRLIEQGVFQKEDIACAIGIQRGLKSGANRHLVAGRAEQAVGWFHGDIASSLRDPTGLGRGDERP